MRKALVALIGTVVMGVLLFPAPAAAKEFAFQGGEPFGAPAVGMTMTGKSFDEPSRVTGFSIGAEGDCPTYTGPDPVTPPIQKGTKGGRGIKIKRDKRRGLHFEWSYTDAGGIYWELKGVQLGPRNWLGEIVTVFPAPPGERCATNYNVRWKAEFTGLV